MRGCRCSRCGPGLAPTRLRGSSLQISPRLSSPQSSHPPPHPTFPDSLYSPVLLTLRYVWEKDGTTLSLEGNPRLRLDKSGSLHISQTWSGDIGTYTCRVLSAGGNDSRSAHLRVR